MEPRLWRCQKLDLKIDPGNDRKVDVKFKTYGCGSAIASSSMFVEMLKGRTIEEAKEIKDKEIAEALELPPIKIHCSVLAEDSIKRAVQDWEEKRAGRNSTWLEKMTKDDRGVDKALQQLASREVGEGITIALMPGGCAGFEYKMDYIGERILDSNMDSIKLPNI